MKKPFLLKLFVSRFSFYSFTVLYFHQKLLFFYPSSKCWWSHKTQWSHSHSPTFSLSGYIRTDFCYYICACLLQALAMRILMAIFTLRSYGKPQTQLTENETLYSHLLFPSAGNTNNLTVTHTKGAGVIENDSSFLALYICSFTNSTDFNFQTSLYLPMPLYVCHHLLSSGLHPLLSEILKSLEPLSLFLGFLLLLLLLKISLENSVIFS